MNIPITKLRSNIYNVIDEVIKSGKPVLINRHGFIVKIIVEKPKSKLARLKKHPGTINGDPESLVHIDWSSEWNEDKNL